MQTIKNALRFIEKQYPPQKSTLESIRKMLTKKREMDSTSTAPQVLRAEPKREAAVLVSARKALFKMLRTPPPTQPVEAPAKPVIEAPVAPPTQTVPNERLDRLQKLLSIKVGDVVKVNWYGRPISVLVFRTSVGGTHFYGLINAGEFSGEKVKINYNDVEPVLATKKESSALVLQAVRLKESSSPAVNGQPQSFEVTLIREGLGNLRDKFYYTKEALESGIALFEGKKIYADHPSESEEKDRPERSVRDILGHFENVHVSLDEDGAALLEGKVMVLPSEQWAVDRMKHAIEYSKKYPNQDFVGLSINANGEAEPRSLNDFLRERQIPKTALIKLNMAQEQGIDTIRVVSKLTDATSCDLVTAPGAGGRVNSQIEEEKHV